MDPKKINSWYIALSAIISGLVIGGAWLYDRGAVKAISFDSPEQKVEHEMHVKALNPLDVDRKILNDSVFREEVRKYIKQQSEDNKDMKKHIHNMDSIQADQFRRFNDQIYQIKDKLNKEE